MRRIVCLIAAVLSLAAGAGAQPHPMGQAIDLNTNLLLVSRLQPNSRQLLSILTAARAARTLMATYEGSGTLALQALAPMLKQQADEFKAGTPVPDNVTKAIEAYYAQRGDARLKMMEGVDAQVQQVHRALAPEQAQLVDWTRPPEVASSTDEQATLDEMRQLLADLNETTRVLERIRYLIASDYATTRVGRLVEFVRQYYRQNTPEFNAAMDWMLRLTDEARTVKEADWPAQAPLFAGRVLQRMGVLEPEQTAGAATQYNWWDIYYLLTDPQTPEWLQQAVGAGGNPANGQ